MRVSAGCNKTHRFHDALVNSSLVSQRIKQQVDRYCSTVSIQTKVLSSIVHLGLSASVLGTSVTPKLVHCAQNPSSCDDQCLSAVVLKLSPAVAAWNRVFPILGLSPAATSVSGCTEVPMYPKHAWQQSPAGALLMLTLRISDCQYMNCAA